MIFIAIVVKDSLYPANRRHRLVGNREEETSEDFLLEEAGWSPEYQCKMFQE